MTKHEKVWGHAPLLSTATFSFVQDGNTLGTTSESEELTIELHTQLPGELPFVVIKSETGWSIDSADDLAKLVADCLQSVKEYQTLR